MSDRPIESRVAAIPPVTVVSSAERRALRAKAHDLDPLVRIGDAGLTDAVVAETDRALTAHGLIKVRVFGDDRGARETIAATLVERLGCALVQSIGKLLVLWRPQPETEPARAPIRRKTVTPPKKLAAIGKPAPKRTRPGVPRPEAEEPAPRRRAKVSRLGRASGPGIRTARGAFDPNFQPRGLPPAAEDAPPRRVRPGAVTTRGAASPARPAGTRSTAPGARGTAVKPRTAASSASAPRGAGTAARSGAAASPRSPVSRSAGTAAGPRGSASSLRRGGATGAGSTKAGGRGASTAEGAAPAARPKRPAPSDGSATGFKPATRSPKGTSSPARPPASGARGTSRSASTPATGTGRPAPRTRAGRREP
jgi:RNA-binding protein